MIIAGSIFILGIIIGSFLNVVIYRIPLDKNIAFPASHCPACQTPLKWWQNIPIISWIFLKGKCYFCNAPISKRYPIVELITGILFLIIYFKVGLVWYLPFIFASFASLLALSIIDIDHMAVPDSVNFAALFFALITPDFIHSIFFAFMAAVGLYLARLLASKLAKKEAMGEADIIVAGTMGALLGFPLFFIAIFLSAILAFIPSFIYREKGVPFVPFLSLGTLIIYIFNFQAYTFLTKVLYG
ncbi:MAG: prepilin peptidase [Sulfurovaceae bacterium]|nr:prepilin peptidase [Sulfurovaceae bacterium]